MSKIQSLYPLTKQKIGNYNKNDIKIYWTKVLIIMELCGYRSENQIFLAQKMRNLVFAG